MRLSVRVIRPECVGFKPGAGRSKGPFGATVSLTLALHERCRFPSLVCMRYDTCADIFSRNLLIHCV